jgi:DNA-binding CsgD family transcriptional regulator
VVAGVRSQQDQLELEVYEQVSMRVPELMLDGDSERQARARATIAALIAYCLEAIEQGPARMPRMPEVVHDRARAAAREGASVGPLLRAIEVGYRPFVGFLIAAMQQVSRSGLVREYLREAYGGLLGDIAAAVEHEYERERAVYAPMTEHNGGVEVDALVALTHRQREVLELLLEGCSYKEIAQVLCVTRATVHTHVSHVYHKLGVKGRSDLMRFRS